MFCHVFRPIDLSEKSIFLYLIVALIYVSSALVGQVFSIPPGNITPVWLPSGLMFALVLRFGAKIWPGIFLGAFFGNVWAYFSLESFSTALFSVFAATFNGLGDVFSIVLFALVVQKLTQTQAPFSRVTHFLIFVALGGVVAPFVSAVFGVTGLTLFGFIDFNNFLFSFSHWWVGDGVGVLLLAPFFFSLLVKKENTSKCLFVGLALCLPTFILLALDIFELVNLPSIVLMSLFLALPAAFAFMLCSGQRAIYIVQLCIVSIAVVATYVGNGPFININLGTPLLSLQFFIAIFSMIVFSLALLVEEKQQMIALLKQKTAELELLSQHDPLTKLWNRYKIEEYIGMELHRSMRSKASFSLFMIDIDDFKSVNDSYGHLQGDRVLVELSQLLEFNTRASDLLGRWGGEEFILVASDSNIEHAAELADKMVGLAHDYDFQLDHPVTISIGYTLSRENDSIESVIERADQSLYFAKHKGKSQAIFST